MNDKGSNLTAAAILIAGIAIAMALVVMHGDTSTEPTPTGRYQMVSHGSNVLVFDTETGKYWTMYMSSSSGSSDWSVGKVPWNR